MKEKIKKILHLLFKIFTSFLIFLSILAAACVVLIISFFVFLHFKYEFGFNHDIKQAEKMFQKNEMLKTEYLSDVDLEKIPDNYYNEDEKIADVITKLEKKSKYPLTGIIKSDNDNIVLLLPYWFDYSFKGYTELYEYNLKNRNLKKLGWINGYYEYVKLKYKDNTVIIYKGEFVRDLLDGKMHEIESPILIFLR